MYKNSRLRIIIFCLAKVSPTISCSNESKTFLRALLTMRYWYKGAYLFSVHGMILKLEYPQITFKLIFIKTQTFSVKYFPWTKPTVFTKINYYLIFIPSRASPKTNAIWFHLIISLWRCIFVFSNQIITAIGSWLHEE